MRAPKKRSSWKAKPIPKTFVRMNMMTLKQWKFRTKLGTDKTNAVATQEMVVPTKTNRRMLPMLRKKLR